MKNGPLILLLIWLSLAWMRCTPPQPVPEFAAYSPELIHRLNNQLTNAILQDGLSPPVASRIYAYCNVAAFEVTALADPRFQTLSGQLTDFSAWKHPEPGDRLNWGIVLAEAYTGVAKSMVYRDYLMEEIRLEIRAELEGDPKQVGSMQDSEALGRSLADHIVNWAAEDGYKRTRNYPLFTPSEQPGAWQPTPPTYMDGIEPYWGEIRPFLLDSADQFRPGPPAEFSENKDSEFFQLTMEVYEAVNELDEGKLAVAKHWDCNPYLSINKGHLMYGKRQLTPGGHWIGITRTASRQEGLDLPETIEAYTYTSLALADGFISCWAEKYRSNLIRPETYINRYIDPTWRPILETPEFPEHTSGHSVISTASATVLGHVFGKDFAFTDSVNVPYGLPPRSFPSFRAGSDEAAISRLFGGIHYRPSIVFGQEQGQSVGEWIVKELETRAESPAQ